MDFDSLMALVELGTMLLVLAAPPVLKKTLQQEVPPIVRKEVAPLAQRVANLERARNTEQSRGARLYSIPELDSETRESSEGPNSVARTPTRKVFGE